jgi:aldehyde dehydrogenase (NAD+)
MATQLDTPPEIATGRPSRYSGFDGQFIGGSWRPGRRGKNLKDADPYTGETIAEIALANMNDLDEAYQAAETAQPAWAESLPEIREKVMLRSAEIMQTRHDEIIDWLVREAGSTRIKAEVEWQMLYGITLEAATFCRRLSGRILPINEPGKESRAYRQPIGVIGVISPWNFPIYLAHRTVGPALALGNAVVVKPSHDTPITGGLLLGNIYEEAGLPPGLLNVVIGSSSEIGQAFVQHDVPGLISFTGSTSVGQQIADQAMTARLIKRVALELGGNTPCVILDDADLNRAVPGAVFGRFLHQGQICMSTNRIIVDAKIYDEFVDRFTQHVRGLKVGNPAESDTVIGPVINSEQLEKMLDLIKRSSDAGARRILGGDPNGLVLPPQVFVDVSNDTPIAKFETFGPIAPIIKVTGESEALRIANDTPFGLSSSVFTRDEARGLRFALGIQAGMTHINDGSVDDTPTGPFGGEKNSGIGRFGGEWIMRELTTDHWITVQHTPRQYPF